MNQVEERLNEMNEYIRNEYMAFAYSQFRPSVEQQNSEHWWRDIFLKEAVNSFDFQEGWNDYVDRTDDGVVIVQEVFVVIEMINKINKWCDDEYGEGPWSCENFTYDKIFKMYAYMYVIRQGLDFWMEQKDMFNEYVAINYSEEDAESVEEEYTGSKDFPPNETDDVCPICFEEYTAKKPRDGIRNSEYKSRCPHYCCVDCWVNIYNDESNTKKRCPICRANVSKWLEDNQYLHLGEYP
jgi:hypothetical protein